MLINYNNQSTKKIKIRVGNSEIEQEKTTKLLGMNIQDNLGWKEHFTGKNGLLACRNITNYINSEQPFFTTKHFSSNFTACIKT